MYRIASRSTRRLSLIRSSVSGSFALALFFATSSYSIPGFAQSKPAATEQKLSANLRIGLVYIDDEANSGEYSLEDFGSRIRWQGQTALSPGLTANGYIELGLDSTDNAPNASGADQTRQMWVGLSGLWGSLTAGAQYGTFYNMISEKTDIAWVGSCWTEFECGRKTRVLKYQSTPSPLVYGVSVASSPNDTEGDAIDQIEYGINFQSDALLLGLASINYAEEGSFGGGNLLGGVVKMSGGLWALTVGYQVAEQAVAISQGFAPQATDDVTNLTFGVTYGSSYLIYNKGDTGNSKPTYFTVGVTQPLATAASIFYEFQQVDSDDGTDTQTFARAAFSYEF